MSRKKTTTRLLSTSPLRSFLLIGGLALFIALSWRALFPGTELGTSVLRTSFNRLSSTVVNFSIPSAGTLSISAGPSAYIGDARVFGLILELENANPTNSSPFIIQSPDLDVFNTINPDNPQEVILTTIFPQGHLTSNERLIAELPFSPTQEGQFLIKSIFFGNLPATTFPAYQEFPIFIESSNILFDANGNAVVVTPPPPPPPPPVLTQCSDGLDNDADGLTDYSADPGCEDLLDNDETDPIGLGPLRLDIPPDLVKVLQKLNHTIEHLVILPPAQQFLQYQFQMEAAGGEEPLDYTWSRVGGALNTNNQYDLPGSGLTLSPAGLIQAAGPELNPGNYQYQLSVSDGLDTLEFSLQIAVYDGFGNPILLQLVPSFTGSEQICTVGQICEASFLTREGRSPYTYTFTGEKPDLPTFPQMSIDGPFYRFTPTTAELGSYRGTMSVSDSSVPAQTAQRDFMLTIVPADIESEFVYSAEKRCDFLDISAVEEAGQYTQFTCRNGVMEGFEGLFRPNDSLNRAEAAKVTSLIVADQSTVEMSFRQFSNVDSGTPVNYNDVLVRDWFANFVYYLFQKGIIIDNDLYRPADTLNVAEAMKLVVESYINLSEPLLNDLEDITGYTEWFQPYQTIASYVDAEMAFVDPALPAKRVWMAEFLYKLSTSYPTSKFQ